MIQKNPTFCTRVFIPLPFLFLLIFSGLYAQNAFITNTLSNSVTVVNTSTQAVVTTIPVGTSPSGVAVSADGKHIYIANSGSANVSVIDGMTNTVTATIGVGLVPTGLTLSPDGSRLYVANYLSNSVSVINTTTLLVIATIPVGTFPFGIVANSTNLYVANSGSNNVMVINTTTNLVTHTIVVGTNPRGMAIINNRVYVTNFNSNTVSVINTAGNNVSKTVDVGDKPFGISISPDGGKVFVANYGSDNITVITRPGNAVDATFPVSDNPFGPSPLPVGVAVSADGSFLIIANSGTNQLWIADASTYAFVATVSTGSSPAAFGNFAAPTITSFPVELTSFGAIYENGQVLLNWTTASELNNAEFEIQRSADGQAFESIGSTPGSGTTQLPQAYTYSDWDPIPDRNYYRLKQVDFDGQFTYSPIVEASISDLGIPILTLSPNPATDEVNLNWGTAYSFATLSVYDALGRLHIRKEANQQAYTRLDISRLTPGMYTVALNVGQESAVKRLLVQP